MKIGDVVTSNHEFISEPDGKIISVNKESEYPYTVERFDGTKATYKAKASELIKVKNNLKKR